MKLITPPRLTAQVIATALSALVAVQAIAADAPPQVLPKQISVVVVRGEGVVVNPRARTAEPILVRIDDQGGKPVPGAAVVFTLPTEGPTGEFQGHAKTLTLTTDDRGETEARGLAVNGLAGKIPIHINASYRGLAARGLVTLLVVEPSGQKARGGHGRTIAILAAIGAAAGVGAAFGLRKNDSASTTPASTTPTPVPIGLTPGAGVIGAPPR